MIDEKYLKTVKNYAKIRPNRKGKKGVSKTYVWDLINNKVLTTVEIDGVVFVDIKKT